MAKEELNETVVSMEELEKLEFGGARRLQLDSITTLCKYVVSNVIAVKTKWGIRTDFTLVDGLGEVILSDWNVITKKRMKPLDLVGKHISIEPSRDTKKVIMNVLD